MNVDYRYRICMPQALIWYIICPGDALCSLTREKSKEKWHNALKSMEMTCLWKAAKTKRLWAQKIWLQIHNLCEISFNLMPILSKNIGWHFWGHSVHHSFQNVLHIDRVALIASSMGTQSVLVWYDNLKSALRKAFWFNSNTVIQCSALYFNF